MLPERLLDDRDRPVPDADLPAPVATNVRAVLRLAATPDRRYAVALRTWRRALRTRAARDDVLILLDAVFDPRRDNRGTRWRLLGLLARPGRREEPPLQVGG